MKSVADVVIIGGGCMGASVAYHLTRRGVTDVVLLERENLLATGSTGRNAGGVRHQFSNESNVRLSIESIRLIERFGDEVGWPVDFHQDGYVFLLSSEAAVQTFRKNVELQHRLGIDTEWLDPASVQRIAPGVDVSGVIAATYYARDGIADPNGVTAGFARAAQAAGVGIERGVEVTGIVVDRAAVARVETTRGRIATRVVVNAAGPFARVVGKMAGVDVPVDPYRRHIFIAAFDRASSPPAVPASHVMVIDFESTFYFHREGAGLLFGMGDRREPSTFDTTVRWDFLAEVTDVAARRLPALQDASISHAWAGLYEMSPDGNPIIGPVAAVKGLFLINGFSGHGFQHSPAAGRVVADLIAGRDPGIDLEPYSFDRFAHGVSAGERYVV
jgi:sarcosine oxidase, subunit beta